jgi:hypothetical protein
VSEVPYLAAAIVVGGAVLSLALCLLFLLVVYLKGGKDDLEVAAKALREVRDVGVAPAVRAALESRNGRDAGRPNGR